MRLELGYKMSHLGLKSLYCAHLIYIQSNAKVKKVKPVKIVYISQIKTKETKEKKRKANLFLKIK